MARPRAKGPTRIVSLSHSQDPGGGANKKDFIAKLDAQVRRSPVRLLARLFPQTTNQHVAAATLPKAQSISCLDFSAAPPFVSKEHPPAPLHCDPSNSESTQYLPTKFYKSLPGLEPNPFCHAALVAASDFSAMLPC